MLIKRIVLDGIVAGTVTLQFRRWKRPTVKASGTLNTVAGQLAIDAVDVVTEKSITGKQARQAGFLNKEALLASLPPKDEAQLYRVRLRLAGPDPRVALRAQGDFTDDEARVLATKLERMDARASDEPWTRATLEIIAERPAVLAATLAEAIGSNKAIFKPRVRRLKSLGLTESLDVGYRLSARGEALLAFLRADR